MILKDGKQIQGIFKYDPTVIYEVGDFVIDGECIYICKVGLESVDLGISPATCNKFQSYPGSLITDINEYEEYLESPNGKEDKYISSNVLSGILQQMYFGFGDSGVIESYISVSGTKINLDTKLKSLIGDITDNAKDLPLYLLIREPSLNNAYVQVSRELAEIKDLVGTGESNCLLRQYTYSDLSRLEESETGIPQRIRVQELVDFENGVSYFRYIILKRRTTSRPTQLGNRVAARNKITKVVWSPSANENATSWVCSTLSPGLLRKINEIINYYNSEREINESTNSGFNFKNIDLSINTTNYCTLLKKTGDDQDVSGYEYPALIDIAGSFETVSLPLTVTVRSLINGGPVYKSYSLTLDTLDTVIKDGDKFDYYFLDNKLILKVAYIDDHIVLTLIKNISTDELNENAELVNIYYRVSNGS